MPEIDDFQRDISFFKSNEDFLEKHLILKVIQRSGDKVITLMGEGVKSIIRECNHLSYKIVTSWCTLLIDIISAPTYHDSLRTRIVQTNSSKKVEKPKEIVSLQSVSDFLDGSQDTNTENTENIDIPILVRSLSHKKDYHTASTPTRQDNEDPIPTKRKGLKYFLFFPLFFLYPVFVNCLRFYMYLWSLILPDYSINRGDDLSIISTSRLPSDIDVNSEAISGLLEDLQIQLFRLIHRCVQTIRLLWISLFNPNAYRTVIVWIVTAISYCSGCIHVFITWCQLHTFSSSLPALRTKRYQRWSEARHHADQLLQSYFGTLEACRPPTLFNDLTGESVSLSQSSLLTKSMLGYPLQEYTVHTTDGYCLVLFRIPRPDSTKAVLLQHGVMDTALAWISDKPSLSLAIQSYLQGYDVFFGSFRGTDGHYASKRHRHEIYDVQDTEYWNFNIDDLILDYRSFIQSIYVIKERERKKGIMTLLRKNQEYRVEYKGEIQSTAFRSLDELFLHDYYTIMGISHSMGGGVTLAYIAESHLTHTAHHLSNVILLSPAGYLGDQSLLVRIVIAISPLLFTNNSTPTAFPTRSSKVHLLIAKVLQDMQSSPATLELVNQICSMVIGGDPQDWPFQKVNYTKYPLGVTSLIVMLHFRQWYQKDQFNSYDYGEVGNMMRYGQKESICFTDYYSQFDVPIHFVAGKYDCIVPSTQVFRHYTLLESVLGDKTSYVEFKNAGHLQFTIGLDHDVLSYVLEKLTEGDIQGYHGIKTTKMTTASFGFSTVDSMDRCYN